MLDGRSFLTSPVSCWRCHSPNTAGASLFLLGGCPPRTCHTGLGCPAQLDHCTCRCTDVVPPVPAADWRSLAKAWPWTLAAATPGPPSVSCTVLYCTYKPASGDALRRLHRLLHALPPSRCVFCPLTMSSTAADRTTASTAANFGSLVYQTLVELPYRSVTVPRQRRLSKNEDEKMSGQLSDDDPDDADDNCQFASPPSDKLCHLFTSSESVSSVLAADPSMSPGDAWHKLYGSHLGKRSGPHSVEHAGKHVPSAHALRKVAECGHWGPTQPSDLFLTASGRQPPKHLSPKGQPANRRGRCTMML